MNIYLLSVFVFSIMGWIWESIYCTICRRGWQNRGFLYGPLCPIYGCGGMIGLGVYDLTRLGVLPEMSVWMIFLFGFLVSMILEYPTSWILEKVFHARWWDYSEVPLNIGGRTSVPTSLAFGAASILVMKFIIPATVSLLSHFPLWLAELLTLLLVAILSADATLTVSALTDFQKRVSELDEAFQNRMTNRVYHMIYSGSGLYSKAVSRISVFKFPTRKNAIAARIREQKFAELIKDFMDSPEVQQMDHYIQHGDTTTLEHCKNVAWVSFVLNERLHLNADEKELVEAAMLHDFYLYDWHDGKPERKTHGFDHPAIAEENAERSFGISDKVKSAIRSHMWPLTITKIPKSREAILLCLVDKYCALIETFRKDKNSENEKKP
ncbi:MAG: HD domain-containing protein [Clostridia bacterium]|nr:HD domain-containing protein [Clostridia bacterium]